MSRATWYRQGKPTATPSARPTQRELAVAFNVSVRGIQRAARILRLAPDLADRVQEGTLTLADAEGVIVFRAMMRAGDDGHT